MILIFGGTTEGRAAVKVVQESPYPYLYSTLGEAQEVATPGGKRLAGALAPTAAEELCRREGVRLVIDAAHPFAEGVHRTVAEAARVCGIPVVRYERRGENFPEVIWCDDYADAIRKLTAAGVERLLALSGVRTIPKLREFWTAHPTRFRILDRSDSIAEAVGYGFPREGLLFFREDEPEIDVLRRESPDAVLTKESGATGRFPEKVAAARESGIPIYAVRRPAIPVDFHVVYTESGLRRRIEELLPGYFPLRGGYTTGTCATAAACAAALGLLRGVSLSEVAVTLPGGERVTLPVARTTPDGEATVVKEAGDDPDVTNGCEITARVTLTDRGEVRFPQGDGVGRVTLPGLGLDVGEPAVNPAPRRMIRENLAALGVAGADVEISVKDGAALAQKTLNPKLGIVGGISIIGTTGIVKPFSNEAFVEAIEREIDVAWAAGCRRLVINSGAKSEAAVRREFPDLPPQAFVHYGNFIGDTLRAAARAGFREVAMGIMIGKAVKLAEGHLDTHSRGAAMNREFLRSLALRAGCSPAAAEKIEGLTLARGLWTALSDADRTLFMPALLSACRKHCAPLIPHGAVSLFLITETGETAYKIWIC